MMKRRKIAWIVVIVLLIVIMGDVNCVTQVAKATLTVSGNAAAKTITIVFVTRDTNGVAIYDASDVITASVLAPATTTPADTPMLHSGNGQYSGAYLASIAGTYHVRVLLNGVEHASSPVTVALASVTSPTSSFAYGAVVTTPTITARGQCAVFSVRSRDQFGMPRSVGGDVVTASARHVATGQLIPSLSITDKGTGVYDVSFCPTRRGVWSISVNMNGVAILNSPYSSEIVGVPSNLDSLISASFDTVSETMDIWMFVHDQFAEPIDIGSTNVTMTISTPSNDMHHLTLTNYGSGVLWSMYLPLEGGSFQVLAHLGSMELKNSPFSVVIHRIATAHLCTLHGDALIKPISTNATGSAFVLLEVRDQYDNILRMEDAFFGISVSANVYRIDTMAPATNIRSTYVSSGIFNVTFDVNKATKWGISVKIGGASVPNTGTIQVIQAASPTLCITEAALVPAGTGYNIRSTMTLYDQFGDDMLGSSVVSASFHTADNLVFFTTPLDRYYSNVFTATVPALRSGYQYVSYSVDGLSSWKWNDIVNIAMRLDDSQSIVSVPVSNGMIVLNSNFQCEIRILSRDQYNQPLNQTLLPLSQLVYDVDIRLESSTGETFNTKMIAALIPSGYNESLHVVSYLPSSSGTLKIKVTRGGAIVGSEVSGTLKQTFNPFLADISGTLDTSGRLNLRVMLRDQYGSACSQLCLQGTDAYIEAKFKIGDTNVFSRHVPFSELTSVATGVFGYSYTYPGATQALAIAHYNGTTASDQVVINQQSVIDPSSIRVVSVTQNDSVVSISLEARDSNGQLMTIPSSNVWANIIPASYPSVTIGHQVIIKSNGTADIVFTPIGAGYYSVSILANGEQLTGSPLDLEVTAGDVRGTCNVVVNANTLYISVQLLDQYNSPISYKTNVYYALNDASCSSPKTMTHVGRGVYVSTATVGGPGMYTLCVTEGSGARHLCDSPKTLYLPELPSPIGSRMFFKEMNNNELNNTYTITGQLSFELADAAKRAWSNGASLAVSQSNGVYNVSPIAMSLACEPTDCCQFLNTASMTENVMVIDTVLIGSGSTLCTITSKIDGEHLSNSPFAYEFGAVTTDSTGMLYTYECFMTR